ncbi:MAG: M24 family metallopeptidase [Anaerolineae bacterium]|nr:M24 family metallopeptidase [Anaerolineae bacterium]
MPKLIELTELELPEFGLPSVEPHIPAETYWQRIKCLRERAALHDYDIFVVYADREHFANLSYLTGYDPRFEEALLILDVKRDHKPILMVGNEGIGYVKISPIFDQLEVVLYQSFSLLGQDRSKSKRLEDVLREMGIQTGKRVGVAGWKHFGPQEADTPALWLEIPSYIADTLRHLTGDSALVCNANGILMDSRDGLRTVNELDQLAWFEFAASHVSQGVRNVLFSVKPGMTEYEAVERMKLNGIPLSCHLMLSCGERAFLGMGSPSARRIQHGDPFTTAYGAWGALTSRAGFMVADASELPAHASDYVERLVAPYFGAIAAWYEHVGIGIPGGELYRIIHDRIGDAFFGVGLNPGHLLHLDEWVNSPIYEGSTETLKSGMALQVDVIPATGTAYYTTNIEDGMALADDTLRQEFAEQYPEAWSRIQARRRFMMEVLGIQLKPEVLPFSNIPAYLPPFLLAPTKAMRVAQ